MCTFMRVLLFGHMTQGFCFCSPPNIDSTWSPFNCENLDNSNYDNSHGDHDFFCMCM